MFTFLHQTDKFIITEIRPLKHFDSEVTILNPKTILPHLTVLYPSEPGYKWTKSGIIGINMGSDGLYLPEEGFCCWDCT